MAKATVDPAKLYRCISGFVAGSPDGDIYCREDSRLLGSSRAVQRLPSHFVLADTDDDTITAKKQVLRLGAQAHGGSKK